MASSSDYFKKARRKFSTTIGVGGISSGGTTLPLTSVTGLDTDTAVIVVVDAVDSAGNATPAAEEVITGVVSGNSLIGCLRGLETTTAQAHAAGANVTMYFTESHWDSMVNGILVGHGQDGTHNTNSITTAAIQDNAVTTAKINASAVTTAKLANANVTYAKLLSTIFGGQVSSYTNSGAGAGTFYYTDLGGIKLLWGITTNLAIAANTTITFTLNHPSSFFTTVQYATSAPINMSAVAEQAASVSSTSTAATSTYIHNYTSSAGTTACSFLVIGT